MKLSELIKQLQEIEKVEGGEIECLTCTFPYINDHGQLKLKFQEIKFARLGIYKPVVLIE